MIFPDHLKQLELSEINSSLILCDLFELTSLTLHSPKTIDMMLPDQLLSLHLDSINKSIKRIDLTEYTSLIQLELTSLQSDQIIILPSSIKRIICNSCQPHFSNLHLLSLIEFIMIDHDLTVPNLSDDVDIYHEYRNILQSN